MSVSQVIKEFRRRENGQDLSEYCLITAAVALIALGIFIAVSGGIHNLWTAANNSLENAASAPATTGAGTSGSHSSGK
jgi:Flp pilus assembly pilin Flp